MKILVIGGGPGGHVAAVKAAELGAEVTMVEKFAIGGTCLHFGCIPTKVLLHVSELYDELKHTEKMGLTVTGAKLDFTKLQEYKSGIVSGITEGVSATVTAKGVNTLYGTATLTGPNQAVVALNDGTKQEVEFDKAIIATGSEITMINIPGIDLDCVVTSNDVLAFTEVPESMVIVGGGVIGLEFAALYSRLGTKITIVEAADKIIPAIDNEMSLLAQQCLEKNGVEFMTGCCVNAIEAAANGGNVKVTSKDGDVVINAQKVLMAIGRRPHTKGLGLEAAGIEVERGAIKIDDCLVTNQPHIYALGDCTGGMMLAHVSQAQGLVAAQNAILGNEIKYSNKTTPGCIYLDPELATVGLSEEKAREMYQNVKVGKWDLGTGNAKVVTMGKSGLIKFVTDGDTGEVLGLHIFGPRASDMIHEGALALGMNATIDDIINIVHAHPTISESIGEAAHDVHQNAIYKLYETK